MFERSIKTFIFSMLVLSLGNIGFAQDVPPDQLNVIEEQMRALQEQSNNEIPDEILKQLFSGAEADPAKPVLKATTPDPTEPRAQPTSRKRRATSTPSISREAYNSSAVDNSPSSATVEGGNDMIDILDLKNMDILDVLRLVSQKSGWNIVAGQNVKGRVTVFLKDVVVEDALRIIVEAYDWAYAKDGDVIKVMTAADFEAKYGYRFGQETQTRVKELFFTNPADLIPILDQVKSVVGKIIPSNKSNALILMDSESKLDEMEMIIGRVDVPTKSEVFELSYAKAENMSTKITELLTPNVGEMRFDIRSNKVIVSDTSTRLKDIRELVEAFDQKDKEVLVDAKIIQVVLNDEYKFGIDWEGLVTNYHQLDFMSDFDVLQSTDKSGKVSIGTLSDDDYTATIEALQTVGETDLLSSPSITTVNNLEAKILVGSTEPYVTSTTTTPASGPTTTAESVNFIDVGVQLYVTPTIHTDDFITMKIRPEVSSVTSTLTTSNNNTIPIVETSEAETTVVVKDRVTIVIGGLIREEKIKNTRQVPILGDVPVLGMFFKNVTDSISKTELVIFLTPTIITGDIEEDIVRRYEDTPQDEY